MFLDISWQSSNGHHQHTSCIISTTATCSLSLCQLFFDLFSIFLTFTFHLLSLSSHLNAQVELNKVKLKGGVKWWEKSHSFFLLFSLSLYSFQFVANLSRIIASSFEKDWTWKVQRESLTQQLVHDTTLHTCHFVISLTSKPRICS